MIAGNGATGLAKLAQPLQLACFFILSKESQVANQKMGLDAGLGLGAASQLGEPGKKGPSMLQGCSSPPGTAEFLHAGSKALLRSLQDSKSSSAFVS